MDVKRLLKIPMLKARYEYRNERVGVLEPEESHEFIFEIHLNAGYVDGVVYEAVFNTLQELNEFLENLILQIEDLNRWCLEVEKIHRRIIERRDE